MTEQEFEAISQVKAWIRELGSQKPPFIASLNTVLAMAEKKSQCFAPHTTNGGIARPLGIPPWTSENLGRGVATESLACECHERDGSYVCEFCRSQGLRGHMEAVR